MIHINQDQGQIHDQRQKKSKHMKLTNKSISKSVRKNLREMAMDLPPENQPDRGVQDKLSRGETPFDKAEFPDAPEERPENNFQELMASERYREVIRKVEEYTGRQVSMRGTGGMMPLQQAMLQSFNNITRTEMQHREELERLAVEIVMDEMKIPEGSFQWDVKIVGMGEVDMEGMVRGNEEQPQQPEQPEQPDEVALNNEVEIADDLENLDLEKAKRRLINSIVQGSAMKGYYMYHNVADRLTQITGSDTLINDYGIMMSVNDAMYWQLPDEMMNAAMQGGGAAGSEEVDRNTDPPTIKARGVNFPVLVHEVIKGVMEVFSLHGLPEDGSAQDVIASEDTLEKEVWDIRLGPPIWARLRGMFPEDIILDENRRELQNYLLMAIFKLPARDFLVFFKEVFEGSERGQNMANQLMDGVRAAFNEDEDETPDIVEFQAEVKEAAEDVDDQDLNTFLQELGIGAAKENPAPEAKGELDDKKLSEMGLNALNYELNQAIDSENWEMAQKIQQMIARKQGNR